MPQKAAEQQERDRSELQPANDDEKRAAQASTRGGDEAPPPSERYHASCAAPAAMRARGATKGWERPETTRLSGGHVPRCWTLVGNDPATQETTRLWKIAAIGSRGEYSGGLPSTDPAIDQTLTRPRHYPTVLPPCKQRRDVSC